MIITTKEIATKIHLIISISIVIPAAIIYGFFPDLFFEISVVSNDEHSAFKAITGLYLGFSLLWIIGVLNPSYLKTALISNTIFMLGLGFGRCLSFIFDAFQSNLFLFGLVGELILGFYGVRVLSRIDYK